MDFPSANCALVVVLVKRNRVMNWDLVGWAVCDVGFFIFVLTPFYPFPLPIFSVANTLFNLHRHYITLFSICQVFFLIFSLFFQKNSIKLNNFSTILHSFSTKFSTI